MGDPFFFLMAILKVTETFNDDTTSVTVTEARLRMPQVASATRRSTNQTLPIVDSKLILTNQRQVSMQVAHSRQFRVRSARQARGESREYVGDAERRCFMFNVTSCGIDETELAI